MSEIPSIIDPQNIANYGEINRHFLLHRRDGLRDIQWSETTYVRLQKEI